MAKYKLQYKPKISRRSSKEMILLFAKYGNHGLGDFGASLNSDADVKRFVASQGSDFDRIVERCRDFSENVPFFENLVGGTWEVTPGATVSIVDNNTKEERQKVTGPGTISSYGYWAAFEISVEARDRAVNNKSFGDFLSAVVSGIASIEGYINYRAEIWNKKHPGNQLIDSRENKVSLDDKFDDWIPIMASGRKLDKSKISWAHFKILRGIRDNVSIHPKDPSQGVSLKDLAEGINMFRTGIAMLLVQPHILFEERIPSVIIRAMHMPDVEVVLTGDCE